MNQYMPRYVEAKSPPPVMTLPKVLVDAMTKKLAEQSRPRVWVCTACGYADRKQKVVMELWDFSIDKHCHGCRKVTEHKLGDW